MKDVITSLHRAIPLLEHAASSRQFKIVNFIRICKNAETFAKLIERFLWRNWFEEDEISICIPESNLVSPIFK